MSDRPAISVVVPFLDNGETIEACIEALRAQQDVDGSYEIILVDNGSTDGSSEIAGRYGDVVLLHEEKTGAYSARNTGIRKAAAPVIALTDADCVVDHCWLRSIQEGMRDPHTAVLVGRSRYPAAASLALRLLGEYEDAKIRYVIDRCPPAFHFAYANNMAIRASVFEELGSFEEWPRAADSELVHRLAARRPDLRLAYRRSMEVTHLEFLRGRKRARRLWLYRSTNARIDTFRELTLAQHLGVLLHCFRSGRGKR